MTYLPSLQPKDVVAIVAPSYGTSLTALEDAKRLLLSWGLTPIVVDDIYGEDLLCANTKKQRLHHLQHALEQQDVRALWGIKGGYGATELMEDLWQLPAPTSPKLLIGFSDISALHLLWNQRWGLASLHAPVLWQLAMQKIDDASIKALQKVVCGDIKEVTYSLIAMNHSAQIRTTLEASVMGGNLAVLQTSLGTVWQIRPNQHLLFLEEVDERPYRVARMLTHCMQAGIFQQVAGVIFGDFSIEEEHRTLMQQVLQSFAGSVSFPVWHMAGIGHEVTNMPLPFGTPAQIASHKIGEHTLTCATTATF